MNSLAWFLTAVSVLSSIGLLLFLWQIAKNAQNGRCLKCGRPVRKTNLFCPWCHCDLRGGGKD